MVGPYITRTAATVKLIEALGGDTNTGMCCCPAHDDNTPSLSVTEGENGKTLFYCFAGCTQDEVLAALKARGLWTANGNSRAYAPTPRWRKNATPKKDTTEFAHKILRVAAASREKPTDYLRERGITLVPDCVSLISRMAAGKLGLRRYPHMVVTIVKDGKPIGVQVTALTRDATYKIEASMPARLTYGHLNGGFVVLAPPEPDRPLIIGEGTETVLSAMQITGLPGIAALSAKNLPKITPPLAVEYILASDNDAPGLAGAKTLAAKLVRAGHVVRLAVPPRPGTDWNDVITKGG